MRGKTSCHDLIPNPRIYPAIIYSAFLETISCWNKIEWILKCQHVVFSRLLKRQIQIHLTRKPLWKITLLSAWLAMYSYLSRRFSGSSFHIGERENVITSRAREWSCELERPVLGAAVPINQAGNMIFKTCCGSALNKRCASMSGLLPS